MALSIRPLKSSILSTVSFGTSTCPKNLTLSFASSTALLTPMINPARPATPKAPTATGLNPASIGDIPPREADSPPLPAIAAVAPPASVAIPLSASSPAPFAPILARPPVTPEIILVNPLKAFAVGATAAAAIAILMMNC